MFESVSWPFELETAVPFVSYVKGKIKESDYWEIQPLLGLLDHGKFPVTNASLRCLRSLMFVST